MVNKKFKIAAIGSEEDGCWMCIVLGEDAECWQVGWAARGHWRIGEVIEVPILDGTPEWSRINWQRPTRREVSRPFAEVSRHWGEDIAAKNNVPAFHPSSTPLIKPPVVFDPDHFEGTRTASPGEKADVANAFVRFCVNGFRREHLSEPLYGMLAESYRMGLFDLTHLSLFYDNNFNTAAKRQQFILKIVKTEPVGDPSITMADIQRAIRAFCIQHVSNKITGTAIRADTIRERRLLRTLLLRHGVPHDLRLPGQTGACTDEGHDRE